MEGDRTTPDLSAIADDFSLAPVPHEETEREDPRTEEGDSRGARLRRKVRSFVMADLAGNMAGKG
ncbi:hypothetical protein [Demequina activiva]|uniref:Uncharacterized protein n=1 Tax=Demequina activiva TaxID=1582364 RepID=A0A919Q5V1_9MICO|nr:hypothetical protein [Demequina activiva]GIG55446.1 hypothetical protein Dac01nite_21980 [Demequina activiva]